MKDPLKASTGANTTTTPGTTSEYLRPGYWDERFEASMLTAGPREALGQESLSVASVQREETYEWCKGFAEFRHLLLPHLRPSDRILVLGCGNSTLSADLWREGYHILTSTDLSEVVIRRMRDASRGMPGLEWRVADMLHLPFNSGSFDAVVEKGAMEVLFADNDSPWDPKPEVAKRAHQMLAEAHRVLTASGVMLSISFTQPHFRRPFVLAPQYSWDMQHATFGDTFHYFVYALRKGSRHVEEEKQSRSKRREPTAGLAEPMSHEHMDREDFLLCIDL